MSRWCLSALDESETLSELLTLVAEGKGYQGSTGICVKVAHVACTQISSARQSTEAMPDVKYGAL
jgi:hypothetical protein